MYTVFQQFYSNKIDNEYNKLAYSEKHRLQQSECESQQWWQSKVPYSIACCVAVLQNSQHAPQHEQIKQLNCPIIVQYFFNPKYLLLFLLWHLVAFLWCPELIWLSEYFVDCYHCWDSYAGCWCLCSSL